MLCVFVVVADWGRTEVSVCVCVCIIAKYTEKETWAWQSFVDFLFFILLRIFNLPQAHISFHLSFSPSISIFLLLSLPSFDPWNKVTNIFLCYSYFQLFDGIFDCLNFFVVLSLCVWCTYSVNIWCVKFYFYFENVCRFMFFFGYIQHQDMS